MSLLTSLSTSVHGVSSGPNGLQMPSPRLEPWGSMRSPFHDGGARQTGMVPRFNPALHNMSKAAETL